MIRPTLLIGALLILAAHVHAQTPPTQDHANTHMLGVWEGKYTSDHSPEGTLRITITHDSIIKTTMEFGTSLQVPPSAFKTITHVGDRVTWTQEVMGSACEGTGTVRDRTFKGEIRCGVAVVRFEVRKRA